MHDKKTVLVTGANGFIGRHCIPLLLKRGYEIHAVSRSPQSPCNGVIWHQTDLLVSQHMNALMEEARPSHLLHLAWYTEHGKYWNAPENLDWLSASIRLLRLFQEKGGRRVLMSGSCVEYDWQSGTAFFREDQTSADSPFLYGLSKQALYRTALKFAELNDLSFAWGRLFFMYGPDEPPCRLVPSVIRALLAHEPARCSHGEQMRDLLYVKDVAEGLVALLDSGVMGAVNVASGKAIPLKQLVADISIRLGKPELIQLGVIPAQVNEPARVVADVTRLRDEVGWQPRFTMEDGLAETIAWWQAHLPTQASPLL